jgi:hypothetical protein
MGEWRVSDESPFFFRWFVENFKPLPFQVASVPSTRISRLWPVPSTRLRHAEAAILARIPVALAGWLYWPALRGPGELAPENALRMPRLRPCGTPQSATCAESRAGIPPAADADRVHARGPPEASQA